MFLALTSAFCFNWGKCQVEARRAAPHYIAVFTAATQAMFPFWSISSRKLILVHEVYQSAAWVQVFLDL
jgi:hypothetical protein